MSSSSACCCCSSVVCSSGGSPIPWHPPGEAAAGAALGPLGEGSGMELTWSPDWKYPGTKHLEATLGKKLSLVDMASAVPDYGAAQVLLDAIKAAATTSAAKVNAAIAKTNRKLAVGHVAFAKNHTAVTGYAVGQWQHGKVVQVYPPVKGAKVECPMKGLK